MDFSVFKLGTAQLPLDLDDISVDARIDNAFKRFQGECERIDKEPTATSRAVVYVGAMRNCLIDIFSDNTAPDKIFGDEARLSGYVSIFQRVAETIAQMRVAAFNAANAPVIAANAARVLKSEADSK